MDQPIFRNTVVSQIFNVYLYVMLAISFCFELWKRTIWLNGLLVNLNRYVIKMQKKINLATRMELNFYGYNLFKVHECVAMWKVQLKWNANVLIRC